MAIKVKETKDNIKAKILKEDCPIKCACIKETDTSIKANIQSIRNATTTNKGIVRLATETEAKEGTISTNVVITPYTLKKATTYIHEQGIASDIWVIEHNLNKKPSVTVVDSADEEQIPDRKIYNTKNTVTLYFLSEFAGKAYLN